MMLLYLVTTGFFSISANNVRIQYQSIKIRQPKVSQALNFRTETYHSPPICSMVCSTKHKLEYLGSPEVSEKLLSLGLEPTTYVF